MARSTRKSVSRRNAVESLENRTLLSALPWSSYAKLIGQDQAAANYPSLTGAGMTVAVIDTGVDYRHSTLGNGFGAGKKVIAGWDFVNNDADPFSDTNGHGTGTAGVIAANGYTVNGTYHQGIATGVNLIALREHGTAGVKASLDWVYANRTKYNIVAVNMTDFGGASALMYESVLVKLIKAGVFVSHPAGNLGAKVNVAPSLDPADFSVGSVDPTGKISDFSQRGAECDLLAPGQDVTLPYYDPATKAHVFKTTWGTSWASPVVVGAAVLIKQIDPRFTPMQIMKIMQDSGVATYDPATKLSYKRINLNAALALAYQRRVGVANPTPPMSNGPQAVRSPFSGTPITLTTDTTLQAEDFDMGAHGVTHYDTDTINQGGSKYRNSAAVDIEDSSASARHLAFVKAGEWLEYTINVPADSSFAFTAKVASAKAGGKFHIEIDGTDKTGAISIPSTGNWRTWTTVGSSSPISLSAGTHVLRLKADSVGTLGYTGNFDSFRLIQQVKQPAYQPATSTINAPFFSAQSGTWAHDGFVSYIHQGDWLAYKGIDFGAGTTSFTASVAADPKFAGRKIQVRLGSPTGAVVGTLTIPNTGGWEKFQSVKINTAKITGVKDVYLTFAGQGYIGNIRWFKFA